MGWMFKLGSDGKKIWNKNLGKLKINACTIDVNDRIFIGGSMDRDTIGGQYSITIFNPEAKRIGERLYTSRGSINDLLITSDGNMFVCGSNWIALMDPRRYIHWDAGIMPPLTATHCGITSVGDFYIAGSNRNTILYAKYSAKGNKIWFQNFDKPDTTLAIRDIDGITQDNLLVLEQKNNGGKIKLFSIEGTLKGSKEFVGIETESIMFDKNGLLLVFNNKDLVLVKFSQLTSL